MDRDALDNRSTSQNLSFASSMQFFSNLRGYSVDVKSPCLPVGVWLVLTPNEERFQDLGISKGDKTYIRWSILNLIVAPLFTHCCLLSI
jgi:hypothetical protein